MRCGYNSTPRGIVKAESWGVTRSYEGCAGAEGGGGRGEASSAQHHQGDGPASLLGRLSMGTEQCVVVVFLKFEVDSEEHVFL